MDCYCPTGIQRDGSLSLLEAFARNCKFMFPNGKVEH
jgi:hypothetical protein